MKYSSLSIVFLVVLVFMTGCSGKVKVKGKVTFPDGSPLTRGSVTFESETVAGGGEVKKDGTYTIGINKPGDGIPPGKYKVYITGAVDMIEPEGGPQMSGDGPMSAEAIARGPRMAQMIQLIDRKFESKYSSGLEVDVKSSMTYDIPVVAPGAAGM